MEEIFVGIATNVSDRAVAEGWADDSAKYDNEVVKSKLWTLIYSIPTIVLLVFTVRSIKSK